jgi:murein DD-endopeptidase MepM/ murein hydrolase activator NlpD
MSNMTPQVWIPLIAQGLVPPLWMAWILAGPRPTRAGWLTHVLALGALLLTAGLAGLWLALPLGLLWVWAPLWAVTAIVGWLRIRPVPRTLLSRFGIYTRAALAIVLLAGAARALTGRVPIEEPRVVELSFPLGAGVFLVANGGAKATVNAHVHTLDPDPRYRPYRGQSYAVDFVAVGVWGSRLEGIHPADPASYAIFGTPVLAPCSGVVVAVRDDLPDLPVPERDREHMAGNHVILECHDAWVVLAHLKERTVLVAPGDSVRVGSALARVGNNGNTDEPHLHIHAQTPGTADEPLSGEPLPMRLDGRWLVRNQRVAVPVVMGSLSAASAEERSGVGSGQSSPHTDQERLP